MKEVEVPKSFLKSVEDADPVFSKKINRIFSKYGIRTVRNQYDAQNILRESNSLALANDLFEELDSSNNEEILTWLDLVCNSACPKLKIAQWLIEKINNINNAPEFTVEDEHIAWYFCEQLRQLRQLKYFDEYVKILDMKKLSNCRIPIVDLVSYSKRKDVNSILLSHIDDYDISGHVLYALNRRHYEGISKLADSFNDDKREFVIKLVKRIKKIKQT